MWQVIVSSFGTAEPVDLPRRGEGAAMAAVVSHRELAKSRPYPGASGLEAHAATVTASEGRLRGFFATSAER